MLALLAGCGSNGLFTPNAVFSPGGSKIMIGELEAPAELGRIYASLGSDTVWEHWESASIDEKRVSVYNSFNYDGDLKPTRFLVTVGNGNERTRNVLLSRMAADLGLIPEVALNFPSVDKTAMIMQFPEGMYTRNELANAADWLVRVYGSNISSISPNTIIILPTGE